MIYVDNILLAPLVLMVWVLDLYLMLVTIRWILPHIQTETASRLCSSLKPLTDRLPHAIQSRLDRWFRRRIHRWVAWLLVLGSVILIRQIVISVLMAGN